MYGLLNKKKAIVTGGAQGIGYAVARIYAENGADAVIADLNIELATQAAKKLTKETGQQIHACVCNVADRASVEAMVAFAKERLGRIDVVCHSAGICPHAEILDMDVELWDKIFAVNVRGTFLVNQAAARVMKEQGGGKIVDISSCSAKKPTFEEAGYCASKGAIGAFIRVAALELGKYKINVNAVCPGATDTQMVRTTFLTSPEVEKEWIEKTALKRLGRPIDQARVVLFLSSELADHITGESIICSAGELMGQ